MTFRVHYLQHVPFEDLGSMRPTLQKMGCQINVSRLYQSDPLPQVQDLDWLIVMGGPMAVNDEAQYPWLNEEKQFIKQVIDAGKRVLGICLGAQLIADVLGATVTSNTHKEIGWFDIRLSGEAELTWIAEIFPATMPVFHWHGDTFSTPGGAIALASSEACLNQGFVYLDRVVGLQFHLETTLQSATALIEHCGNELDGSAYVQSAEQMLADSEKFELINQLMEKLLMRFAQDD
ncbi:type 1 glutamine amidotransferase [Neptunicella sp. SCSIO 80796]|uniref:type 1 glutamine amidotransferase n=1 Tax=Neptunicella plasticusilytica TaxID=3117012 RepID=UPI003A4E1129